MAKASVAVKIEGFEQLRKKLDGMNPIYAEPWTKVIRRATAEAFDGARNRAPVRRGVLKASIRSQMDARTVPLWGKVTADANNRGFRYPFALDAGKGKKTKEGVNSVLRYRGRKKQTKNWFKGSWTGIRKKVSEDLRAAAKEIERSWSRW